MLPRINAACRLILKGVSVGLNLCRRIRFPAISLAGRWVLASARNRCLMQHPGNVLHPIRNEIPSASDPHDRESPIFLPGLRRDHPGGPAGLALRLRQPSQPDARTRAHPRRDRQRRSLAVALSQRAVARLPAAGVARRGLDPAD